MLNLSLRSDQLREINNLLDRVSKRQLNDFGSISSDTKTDGTLITSCDVWSDATIVSEISRIAPNEGVLSEEGSKLIPKSNAYWVVDPLDGTTNFAAGIPYWSISVARFVDGKPTESFLDIPALNQRIVAIKNGGVWRNGKQITINSRDSLFSSCVSLCSRSIKALQFRPNQIFPGKVRLLGVSSLNLVSVALGQTVAALEATPKIWDMAAAWLVLEELGCQIRWLDVDPTIFTPGEDLSEIGFPMIAACSFEQLERFLPWGEALIKK